MFKTAIATLYILFITATTPATAQVNIDTYRVFGDDNRIYWSYDITDNKEHNLKDWKEYDTHFSLWVEEMNRLNTQTLNFKNLLKAIEMSPACYYITDSRIFPPRAHLYRLTVDKTENKVMKSNALYSSFATLVKYENVDPAITKEYKRIFNLMTICGAMINANGLSIFSN